MEFKIQAKERPDNLAKVRPVPLRVSLIPTKKEGCCYSQCLPHRQTAQSCDCQETDLQLFLKNYLTVNHSTFDYNCQGVEDGGVMEFKIQVLDK